MLTIDGLASGIDTTKIVEGLLEIQQKQIDQFESRKTKTGVQQASFSGLESRLLSLRNDLSKLTTSGGSVFRNRSATSSDESLVQVAASSNAPVGSYQIKVNQLAQSHQVATQGFDDPGSLITEGDLTLQVGSGAATTITIDSSNNTLQGLVDSINRSDAGVSAVLINDGSASPYRLMLTAEATGAANDIRITNGLGATAGSATQPQFDLGNAIQDPLDANVTLGSGAGAITVNSSTNHVENVVPGVTLNLLGADPAKAININVTQNSDATIESAQAFVESYNNLMSYIDSQARFTAETEDAGPLLGNRAVIRIQDDLRLLLTESIGGLNPSLNRLTAAGFSLDDKGQLSLDETRLRDLVEGRVEGVDSDDVARLFALGADSDTSGVSFVFGSSRTAEGEVQVDITSAATTAVLTAGSALAGSTVIDGTNNTLDVDIDGANAVITLAAGTYTQQELADQLQIQLNSHQDLRGRQLEVSLDGGALRIESLTIGSASEIQINSGTALTALGLSGGESARGQDVVGKFIVNGEEELATGRGNLLVGNSENRYTADLQVRASLAASQLVSGPEATLNVTRGVASRLDQLINEFVDPVNGRIKSENDRFDDQIESIDESIERLKAQFEAQQESLLAQFVSLESTISELQNTGNFLASQLGGISLLNNKR
ncbi:MAG: flagellar filament capping protein FliD [Planctomycetales bacterium]|nr:flagellar filament capping protein FliD [Planctomycetales bacterium]